MTLDSGVSAGTWQDTAAPVPERVADLMTRMTTREKVAQRYGLWLDVDEAAGEVAPHQHDQAADPVDWPELIRHGLGQVTRVYGTVPVAPVDGAHRVAGLQRQIVAAGRFGVPAIMHEECLTGLAAWQATIYPAPLSWGASFDPDLVEQVGARIGDTMRRLGVQQGLAPVLDVVRDLRWGRVEETIGEDPYLVGTIGSAYVRGLQSAGVVATLKHFVAYSASRAGRNLAPVSLGPRELADVLLPPFEMALRAGARSVMNSYADIDGVPVAADATLLTDLLRGRLGFTGTVVSDYFSVAFLQRLHGVAGSRAEAAAAALHAGIDVELPGVDCYGAPLLAAIATGHVDEALVDRAVARVLTQKCELGLLDPDWRPEPPGLATGPLDLDDPTSRALARRLAERSVVLLRNEPVAGPAGSSGDGSASGAGDGSGGGSGGAGARVLPLRPGLRVAVVGPGAADPASMLGCYSFPRHIGVHHPEVALGVAVPSLLDALRADPAGYAVTHAPGCPVLGGDDEDIAAAVAVAAAADVCVVALGDLAGLFGGGTSGEGCDVSDLRLPGRQEELLDALLDTGTPVVLVLLVGRPYELSRQVDRLAAALCAFFPGEEGAAALADVLSGRVDPSGHLPVSFPAAGASQPATYLAPQLGHRSDVSSVDPSPVFPFGHGLSYTPATWGEVTLSAPGGWPTDGTVTIAVPVHNGSDRATSTVIQVYLHDPVAEVARPVNQLVAAPRVDLAPHQSRTVVIGLHADLVSYTGRDGRRLVEPGEVELRVGTSSVDIHRSLRIPVVGARRHVGADRHLQPSVIVHPSTTVAPTDQ